MYNLFYLLEEVSSYHDTWNLTFYYVLVLVILIGIFWTYMQVFVKPLKTKKEKLNENIIYQNNEDTIEESYKKDYKSNKNNKNKKNNKKN